MFKDLREREKICGVEILYWAASPEGAAVDLGSSLRVRRELQRRRPDPDAVWEVACRLMLQLRGVTPLADEPIVQFAHRELGEVMKPDRAGGWHGA